MVGPFKKEENLLGDNKRTWRGSTIQLASRCSLTRGPAGHHVGDNNLNYNSLKHEGPVCQGKSTRLRRKFGARRILHRIAKSATEKRPCIFSTLIRVGKMH